MVDDAPRVLRVNLSNLTTTFEQPPERYRLLGGRALTSTVVSEEVPPMADPLGAFNKLVFAPGIVGGTTAPSSGRLSVGGKSPLTRGIKEANAGGATGQKLARLGIKAIIIEGQAEPGRSFLLNLGRNTASLAPAGNYAGIGMYEFASKAKEQHGEKAGFIACGPAGEMGMAMAGVSVSDVHNLPGRYAGRGGLGAVMGSKGLKGIIVDDSGGKAPVPKDPEAFAAATKVMVKGLLLHPVTSEALPRYGTNVLQNILNEAGGLPTRCFKTGRFEGAGRISGETMHDLVDERGGAGYYGRPCMPGCVIQCNNFYPAEDGSPICGPVEYESVWALGSNCGIDNFDDVAWLNYICNDVGIDTIEAGNTVAIAMEAGLLPFGDGKAAQELLREVGKGTPLGRIIGQGGVFTGQAFGVRRVAAVRGQCMPAYDPRAVRGIGVTYATSPMGADHTAGYTTSSEILGVGGKADPLSDEGKIELSRQAQIGTAFLDSTGYCLFTDFCWADNAEAAEAMRGSLNAMLGVTWTAEDTQDYGRRVLEIEREFNEKAGVGSAYDRLPEFFYRELLSPHNVAYSLGPEDFARVFRDA